ncbi:MAG: lytic transglycosylase domain-containing protein [Acidobacteriia bacterium]|nr:lytic transglycosylase domain-containing protein [Terriglobia bacterium]
MAALALLCGLAPGSLQGQAKAPAAEDFDAWRAAFDQRLDAAIAELRENTQQKATPPFTVTWGSKIENHDPLRLPSALARRDNQNPFPTLAGILRAKGLPSSLVGVAGVESGFNSLALSPKGARGLWQLMPATARRYGLIVEPHHDERVDPVKSTLAAAAYITDLYAQFGDWPLVFAAYNAGEDRVARALNRVGARDFWTLGRRGALPEETLRYVPEVLARLGTAPSSPGLPHPGDESQAAQGLTPLPGTPLPNPARLVYATTAPFSEPSADFKD